jgi:hypothetical protein
MSITLINYANSGYVKSRAEQKETALTIAGFNKVIEYNYEDIDDDFKRTCSKHFDNPRGAGYWVWKPYFILKTLDTLQDGDVLAYCDSGACFKSSILPYINKMKGSIMLFYPDNKSFIEKVWTKMDILKHLQVHNNMTILQTVQLEGGFILLKKSDISYRFITEWLELCKDYHLISDEPSIKPNLCEFTENRHDQALLSILGKKHRVTYNIDIEDKPFVLHHKNKN